MKPRAWAWLVTVAVAATSARAQGTFQNLDFEAAKVAFVTNSQWANRIATTNALPGWTAFVGTNQLSLVVYNGGYVAYVALNETNAVVINGSFSVGLNGGAISQTGLVPADARSLQFKVKFSGAAPNEIAEVWLGGERLPLVPLGAQQGYFLDGADISSFAGQTETLSFSGGSFALDDIEFSPYTLTELPRLLALQSPRRTPDGQLVFDVVTAFPGQPTFLEASPDMARWTRLSTNWPAGSIFTFTDAPPARVQRRFYRAVVGLP